MSTIFSISSLSFFFYFQTLSSLADSSLFVHSTTDGIIILLFYVYDMLVTSSSRDMVAHFLDLLKSEFAVKDLGDVHYFLGIEIKATETGLRQTEKRYAEIILERAHMLYCKPVCSPLSSRLVAPTYSDLFHNVTLYRALVGSLQHLTFTRPDLTFSCMLPQTSISAWRNAFFDTSKVLSILVTQLLLSRI